MVNNLGSRLYNIVLYRRDPPGIEGLRLLSEGLRQIGEPGETALLQLTKDVGRVLWNSPFTVQLEGTPDPGPITTTFDVGYIPAA